MGGGVKVAAAGARLLCDAGSKPSLLLPTSAAPVLVEGKAVATIFDGVPFSNIPPFGTCKIKGGPCVPSTPGPWAPALASGASAVPAPLLPFGSTLECAIGGRIYVADCNQASMLVGGPEQPEASPGPTPEEREAMDDYEARLLALFGGEDDKRIHEEELARRVETAKADEERLLREIKQLIHAGADYAHEIVKQRRENLNRVRTIREHAEINRDYFRALARAPRARRGR